ncbi:MAG: chromate resistance protein [Desulfovibrio sp.]|uniref:chromate resistance protein ChrB domain-containing protein n=1 Tax=Desulfovibrio sp. TaxID=885 RepID=UPI00135ED1C0|nr:chromate resistance protein ChrB domain-containing protein [Desulfovibrio sp.]MTJ91843.1 chromate resistance protein [Desulfovibrio sp.]
MNNNKWLFFSFSVPSRLQGFRVKIWRKLNALGAVQIKNSIYVLPANQQMQEHLIWMGKETDEQGGESLVIANGSLLNIADSQVVATFTRARDEDYLALGEEIRAVVAEFDSPERLTSLRKLEKRLEAISTIDFFPSGKGASLQKLLDEALHAPAGGHPVVPRADVACYRQRTWVTRANPYVDRLASFWLIKRFVDPAASIMFLQDVDAVPSGPDVVSFDMSPADFTHVGGLITFEVIAEAFALTTRIPQRMRKVIKAIDLEELDAAPVETPGIKRMLDGLVAANDDDHLRTELALAFFDTLLASYTPASPTGA